MPKIVKITLGVAGLLVVGISMFFLLPSGDKTVEKKDVCTAEEGCPQGFMCAAGGCVLLLADELPAMWADDLDAQLNPESQLVFKSRGILKKKLEIPANCGAKTAAVKNNAEVVVTTLDDMTVYQVQASGMKIHRQKAARGNLWMESFRVDLPQGVSPGLQLCLSPSVAFAQTGHSGKNHWVDVAFRTAVTVGGIGTASLMVEADLPPEADNGERVLKFHMGPAAAPEDAANKTVFQTAVVFPLGTSIVSMDGPPPTKQRLFTGAFAYLWDHGEAGGDASVRFILPRRPVGKPFNFSELMP